MSVIKVQISIVKSTFFVVEGKKISEVEVKRIINNMDLSQGEGRKGLSSMSEMTNCPICFEVYQENGERVPRILPCHHTLCESCVTNAIKENSIQCPECRVSYQVDNGVRTFPQNKYILGLITVKAREANMSQPEKPCEEHSSKELSLYCNDCEKAICLKCLSTTHRGHDVVDLQLVEEERDFMEKIESLMENLQINKDRLTAAKEDLEKISADGILKIQAEKEKHVKLIEEHYNSTLKAATDRQIELSQHLEKELTKMRDVLAELQSLKDRSASVSINIPGIQRQYSQDFQSKTQSLEGLCDVTKLPVAKRYRYFDFETSDATVDDVKKLCGHLVEKANKVDFETSGQLLEIKEDDEEDINLTAENGANTVCDVWFKATGKSFV